jgi:hypothetical protein
MLSGNVTASYSGGDGVEFRPKYVQAILTEALRGFPHPLPASNCWDSAPVRLRLCSLVTGRGE